MTILAMTLIIETGKCSFFHNLSVRTALSCCRSNFSGLRDLALFLQGSVLFKGYSL